MNGVNNKRTITGIAIIGVTSLCFYFYHLIDLIEKGIQHSILLIGCELIIPEVFLSLSILVIIRLVLSSLLFTILLLHNSIFLKFFNWIIMKSFITTIM